MPCIIGRITENMGVKGDSMDFRPIDISMKGLVEKYSAPWKLEGSEYTFSNILIWGAGGNIRVAEEDGALYILLHWGGERFMFAPLTASPDASNYQRSVDRATEYMLSCGIEPRFKGIFGSVKTAFEGLKGYTITEDRNNSDYIYSMESLRDLSGKKLHAKRNHIHQFMAQYGDSYEYVTITPDMADECIDVYNEWYSEKDPEDRDITELFAIKTLLKYMDELGIRGGGIRIDGTLAAFTLGQKLNDSMALVHIEKADSRIVGLYTVINNLFVKNALGDVTHVNREEDMGLEGLRKAKLSYYPAYMIDKFEGRPIK